MIRLFINADNTIIQFPVNPAELKINADGDVNSVDLISVGEYLTVKLPKLLKCSFSSFFPADDNPPYVVTKGKFEPPQFYIDFFDELKKNKKYFRFIVTDTKINFLATIETFEYGLIAGSDDIEYSLTLREVKPVEVREVTIVKNEKTNKPAGVVTNQAPARAKTGFSIGDTVIVNGEYFYSSYGAKPSAFFSNFTGKISHIVTDRKRKYRYHITTLTGKYRGWVSENQIKHSN